MKSVSALFIHRSVGNNLLRDGNLKNLVVRAGLKKNIEIDFKDINNNLEKGTPGEDTKPKDYAVYFKNHARSEDIVIIKSCYPNNAIRSDSALRDLKNIYKEIVKAYLSNSKGKLIIMTTPPLRPLRTTSTEAERAKDLERWITEQSFGTRVKVFDFYEMLSDQSGVLKSEYRRLLPWDNHPNSKASRIIAPKLADYIAEFFS